MGKMKETLYCDFCNDYRSAFEGRHGVCFGCEQARDWEQDADSSLYEGQF